MQGVLRRHIIFQSISWCFEQASDFVGLSLVAGEVWATTAQWAASCQQRRGKWKSFEITICTCLCNRLSVCTRSFITAQLMHGTGIARLSSQGIRCLLSSPLAPKGEASSCHTPGWDCPGHVPEPQTWEHPTWHTALEDTQSQPQPSLTFLDEKHALRR